MTVPCGCCEGTEVLTPQKVTNRPGLKALAYRIGTHATFLETMKARLSAADFKELENLTTRVASDPAIAWLDAWATVADVLTFYQERIANEGYLRTATERRSILELARLVGYSLRPGVAASVYLAYALEEKQHVDIPVGAQAQSVPGPGELPEMFETSDKLETRTDWNTLQVRLTRPQDPERVAEAGEPIYFKGTATNLKANDMLLVETTGPDPLLLRIVSVTPDEAAARTKVNYQLWTAGPENLAAKSFATAPTGENVERVRSSMRRFIRLQDFGVSATSSTVRRIMDRLQVLSDALALVGSNAALKANLESALADLLEIQQSVLPGFVKIRPWLAAIITAVSDLSDSLAVSPAGSSVGAGGAATTTRAPLEDISQIVGDLEKREARPPASSEELSRTVSDSFSTTSDVLPKLLVTMRPKLRDVLYRAWENLPVTERAAARVYALRTRALVFGNNAPLKLTTDTQTGRVTGAEEWTLFRTKDGKPLKERLNINNEESSPVGDVRITITLTLAGVSTTGNNTGTLSTGTVAFDVRVGTELVNVTVTGGPAPKDITKIEYVFTQRGFSILAVQSGGNWTATSAVIPPTRVAIDDLVASNNGFMTIAGNLTNFAASTPTEEPNKVSLDASYKQILPGSWAILERPLKNNAPNLLITHVNRVREASRADYGIAGSGTQLELNDAWINVAEDTFAIIRGTAVFAQSEQLELAEAPIDPLAEAVCRDRVELNNLIDGLTPGRWLIVSGERADITHPPPGQRLNAAGDDAESVREILHGVNSTELVMLGGVEQGYDQNLPGDKTHTTLILSPGLAYCYKRDTVTIYGNVVEATHGESHIEVLGSGDGSKSLQRFDLRQSPVTFVPAPTVSGVDTTLHVRVNEVEWHESHSLDDLKPADRKFITRTDDKDLMTVIFGDGVHGARLPTGVENVTGVYRTGIGKPGNVKAEQIKTPVTRPLGVKSVINPLRASGGADRESRDSARRNAPLAVMALDRLVSTRDYEDFARTFAGIGKASAARLSDGQQQLVHLTIAGAEDIPIDTESVLFRSLVQALNRFGDPFQAVQVAARELMLLVISARVRVLPDYLFESVAPRIRAALLDTFGFDRRELGQSVFNSEIVSTIQNVEGVSYVDLDVLESVSESEILSPSELAAKLDEMVTKAAQPDSRPKQFIFGRKAAARPQAQCASVKNSRICPAQLAFLSPEVPETLILTELSV